jgi:hypothetical protein
MLAEVLEDELEVALLTVPPELSMRFEEAPVDLLEESELTLSFAFLFLVVAFFGFLGGGVWAGGLESTSP